MPIKSIISAVAALLVLAASSAAVAAPISSAAAWTTSGVDSTSATDTATGVALSYHKGTYWCAGCGDNYWDFSAVADAGGTGSFDIKYDAFNAWYLAGSDLTVYVNGVSVANYGGYDFSTPQSLTVNAGDTILIRAHEYNYDLNYDVFGTIQLTNFAGAFAPATVPEPGSLALIGLGLAGFAASRRKLAKRAL